MIAISFFDQLIEGLSPCIVGFANEKDGGDFTVEGEIIQHFVDRRFDFYKLSNATDPLNIGSAIQRAKLIGGGELDYLYALYNGAGRIYLTKIRFVSSRRGLDNKFYFYCINESMLASKTNYLINGFYGLIWEAVGKKHFFPLNKEANMQMLYLDYSAKSFVYFGLRNFMNTGLMQENSFLPLLLGKDGLKKELSLGEYVKLFESINQFILTINKSFEQGLESVNSLSKNKLYVQSAAKNIQLIDTHGVSINFKEQRYLLSSILLLAVFFEGEISDINKFFIIDILKDLLEKFSANKIKNNINIDDIDDIELLISIFMILP